MRRARVAHHTIFYLLEITIVSGGLLILLALDIPFWNQLFVLLVILLGYIILGLVHHRLTHNVKFKIVLEYFLISAIILVSFIFLNSSKI